MSIHPSAALGLVLTGFLLLYAEALRPGLILPGVLGLMAIVSGFYEWYLHHPTYCGAAWLAVATVLFAAEAFSPVPLVAGALAGSALAWGLLNLFGGPNRISPAFSVGGSVLFAVITTWLARLAWRARLNKRSSGRRSRQRF